jgi:CHAT domain-containing protein
MGQVKFSGKKIVMNNPLFCSGLVLAGANRAIRGESKSDDGILTADKILSLRLWGTKLVVLSACETGLGEVRSGEGIFGLRRAFNQVGAKSLVMSMWKVPDKETQELMVNFYRNIYEQHMDYNKALRQATLTQLQTVKARYGHANPYYWGAFIFSGDPNRAK